jgi:hypothetical protein
LWSDTKLQGTFSDILYTVVSTGMSPDYDNIMESVWVANRIFTFNDGSFSLFMLKLIPTQLQFEQTISERKVKNKMYMWHSAEL